jgi:hypothetical protein
MSNILMVLSLLAPAVVFLQILSYWDALESENWSFMENQDLETWKNRSLMHAHKLKSH